MGREVSEWFPDGRGGGDTGESPWAVRPPPELVTFSLRAGKKNLSSESESRVEELESPSSRSLGSCRHLSPQPVSAPPTCERPPTSGPRCNRETSGRFNLSVATPGKARALSLRLGGSRGLPPSSWWASPSLVAGGVPSACLLPSAPSLGSTGASP